MINVGSAEGYYAIGFAKKLKNSKIIAFDIDSEARKKLKIMCQLNSVENKIEIKEDCTPEILNNINLSGKGLIISDCEGYEEKLFSETRLVKLKRYDMLVEVHNGYDKKISYVLIKLLNKTHKVYEILRKQRKSKNFKINLKLNKIQKLSAMYEERGPFVHWIFFESKN